MHRNRRLVCVAAAWVLAHSFYVYFIHVFRATKSKFHFGNAMYNRAYLVFAMACEKNLFSSILRAFFHAKHFLLAVRWCTQVHCKWWIKWTSIPFAFACFVSRRKSLWFLIMFFSCFNFAVFFSHCSHFLAELATNPKRFRSVKRIINVQ